MSDLRQRLAAALSGEVKAAWYPPVGDVAGGWSIDVGDMPNAALAVFAEWLREHAAGARFIAENAPDDEDLTTVATWGGARAALSALADEIDPRAPEGARS